MATLMCISDDGNKATFIGTFLETGANVRLCDECMPNFCAAVFEQMTGVDMEPALFMASQEGAEVKAEMARTASEVAYPPAGETPPGSDVDPSAAVSDRSAEHGVSHGAPSTQPPAPAPADHDQEAGRPTAGGGELGADDALTPPPAETETASERTESPPTPISRGKRRAA